MIVGSRFSRYKPVKPVRPVYFRIFFMVSFIFFHNEWTFFGYFRYHHFGHSCIYMGELILKLTINRLLRLIHFFFKCLAKFIEKFKKTRSEPPSQVSSGNVQRNVINGELYDIDLSINENRKEEDPVPVIVHYRILVFPIYFLRNLNSVGRIVNWICESINNRRN